MTYQETISETGKIISNTYTDLDRAFREEFCGEMLRSTFDPQGSGPFKAKVQTALFDDTRVVKSTLSPGQMRRNPKLAPAEQACGGLLVVSLPTGAGELTCEGRTVTIDPVSVAILHADAAFDLDLRSAAADPVLLWIELNDVVDLRPLIRNKGVVICSSSLSDYISFFCDFFLKYGHGEISKYLDLSIRQSIIEMLRAFLRDQVAREDGGNKTRLANEIIDYIKQNLDAHDLGAARISRHFNISQRKLYKIFEDSGLSLRDTILHYRLEAARKELASASEKKIINIAFDSGFNDVSTFYRNFKRKYGYSPRHTP